MIAMYDIKHYLTVFQLHESASIISKTLRNSHVS